MTGSTTRQTIAVLTDAFAPFHRLVIDGLEPHFTRAGYGTLCITGRDVSSDRFTPQSELDNERLRSLGHRRNVAGAIIVSGAIPPEATDAEVSHFVEALTDGPVVSLGIELPGVASVTIRWQEAIDDLVAHMTSDPRRRRFVFVRGYRNDPHSVQRERGFRAGMAAAGLTVDDDLVICGNYNAADTLVALDRLIRQGHRFDGVIAANDDMASGALAALTRHEISVPDDVIVSGFDDALVAFTSVPPLTTARLDTDELTRTSADVITTALASGVRPASNTVIGIDSRLVVRASSRGSFVERDVRTRPVDSTTAAHIAMRLVARWEADHAPPGLDVEAMARAIGLMATDGDDDFEKIVTSTFDADGDKLLKHGLIWWHHAVRTIRTVLIDVDGKDISATGLRAVADQLDVIDRKLRPIQTQAESESQLRRDLQERLIMNIASCSDTPTLWNTLRTGFQTLGMTNAWVAISDDAAADEHGGTMRLMFALNDERLGADERFATCEVLPPERAAALDSKMHVLVPLRAGLTDIGYLITEPSGDHLMELEAIASGIAQVLRHVRHVADLEDSALQLRDANAALDRLARLDSLTGLPNRKMFLENLSGELNGRGETEEVAVLFFDLDGFKAVNDTLGHESGDRLLKIITRRVGEVLTPTDTFARLGGDEFTIVLRQRADAPRATQIAGEVLRAIATPVALPTGAVQVTASLGIAVAPQDGEVTHDLIHRADAAMYDAKALGKNCATSYTSGEHTVPPADFRSTLLN